MVRIPADDSRRNMVRISNPLGEENSVMRTCMLSSVMKTLRTNYTRRNPEAAVFEIGTTYLPAEDQTLPDEKQVVAIGMYGDCDFYDLKGTVEQLFQGLGIQTYDFEPYGENPSFHPGRCALVSAGGKPAGVLGRFIRRQRRISRSTPKLMPPC